MSNTTDNFEKNAEERDCATEVPPGSTVVWIPECDPCLKPFEGQVFETLDDGIDFYIKYAANAGFDVWRSSDEKNKYGTILRKRLMVCSREGFKGLTGITACTIEGPKKQKRRRTTYRVGCWARIAFKLGIGGRFEVKGFEEEQTHSLCKDRYKPFMKVNRKLDIGHQQFITNCLKVNIGASQSFDLYAEMVGGVANVGATKQDFKNYKREMLEFMREGDAQMVISKYLAKKADDTNMFFEYEMNEQDNLARLFWADGVARKNYVAFGDVVSFDATYQTNRYKLVFVPFTGVDNHKRCVTFGAGLIDREDVESYRWCNAPCYGP
ncbi:PREDICTED: protein FAR1-RELATED SEQUENCE 5-like [Ipomoea nil]|uniref:protein FAR1-RELATED SEQUENCE 5-like n=1 Tax=Ipomoea nil TaxID=35883 RepID=UPI0009011593|nr:PREDICTED: protein FAR1-RELATED SEQUENCE 5-like [Ipomoea nil]